MGYPAPSKEAAERAAAFLTASRVGLPSSTGSDRTITAFIVERYPMPDGRFKHNDFRFEWGVVERWRYDSRPDLPEMGGAFVDLRPEMFA